MVITPNSSFFSMVIIDTLCAVVWLFPSIFLEDIRTDSTNHNIQKDVDGVAAQINEWRGSLWKHWFENTRRLPGENQYIWFGLPLLVGQSDRCRMKGFQNRATHISKTWKTYWRNKLMQILQMSGFILRNRLFQVYCILNDSWKFHTRLTYKSTDFI